MPIDPNFEENAEREGEEHGVAVWGPTDPPEKLGIRGTHVAVDWFGGAVAARVGGASMATTALAGGVGLVLLFVAGPLGVLLGVAGTVFALEYYRNRDAPASGRTALYATVGMLGSALVQVLLTGSMLVAFVLVLVF